MPSPLLELIKQNEGLAMINYPEERSSESMWEKKEKIKKKKIRKEFINRGDYHRFIKSTFIQKGSYKYSHFSNQRPSQ